MSIVISNSNTCSLEDGREISRLDGDMVLQVLKMLIVKTVRSISRSSWRTRDFNNLRRTFWIELDLKVSKFPPFLSNLPFLFSDIKICFGTSNQVPISSPDFKRNTSLLNTKPETIIDIGDKWKKKHVVDDSSSNLNTYERIYVPASNIERKADDGCMKKIKIERSLKLRQEDLRARNFNVITNNQEPENTWIDSFGVQKE